MSRPPWRSLAVLVSSWALVATALAQPPVAIPTAQQVQPPITPMMPGAPAPVAPQPAAPDWAQQLTPQQLQQIDLVLRAWEQKSSQVQTFSSEFDLWEYDLVWGKKTQRLGEVKYAQPDKGMYRIKEEAGEYWMCDGKSVYQFNHQKKQLIEHQLPPQLQGKAISDGPLPFVFGVEAEKMKRRYWIRIVTPKEFVGREIRLEVCPKFKEDAANFMQVDVILTEPSLTPAAVQVHDPNGKVRKVYSFVKPQVNAALDRIKDFWSVFVRPATPLGWQYLVDAPHQPQPTPPPVQGPAALPPGQVPMPAQNNGPLRPLLPRR